jgi:glutaredoxin
MLKLQVYVRDDCWSCAEARRLVKNIAPLYPEIVVEMVNVEKDHKPDSDFAVPTFMLDGQIISLGNPYPEELQGKIEKALTFQSM